MTEVDVEADEDHALCVGIALVHKAGCYLARIRPPGGPMPGVWEFPGGKCEPGESPEHASIRECREESGLDVTVLGQRAKIRHAYPHGAVILHYYDCIPCDENAAPDPASQFLWLPPEQLIALTFPEANAPILRQLAAEAEHPDIRTS